MNGLIDDQDLAGTGEQGEVDLKESQDDLGIGDEKAPADKAGEAKDGGSGSDGEDDAGADGEGEDEGEEDTQSSAAKKPPAAVPYTRFKEVNDAKKAAQEAAEARDRENAELRAKLEEAERVARIAAAKPANDAELMNAIKAARKKYEEARLDDDEAAAEAAALAEEEARQALAEARADAKRAERERQAAEAAAKQAAETEAAKLQRAAEEMMQQYPDLATDEQLQRFVVAERDALIAAGASWGDALRDATAKVAGRLGMKPANGQAPAKSKREQESIRRHAEASATLPARGGPAGEGQRSRGAGMDLSAEEYHALPEDEKASLLGIG